jgi:pilus assembly protein CpaC
MATGTSLRAAVVTIVAAASWTASHRAAAAADALIANPRTQPITITASDLGSHSVALGVGKSVVIDLPHDIKDVLVGDPKIANAVIRSARRAYIVGNGVGQTNVYFFDAEGRQMAGFDIAVTRDLNGIRAAIRQVLPEADIRVEGIGEGVVLSGTASSQAEAQQAYDIAVRLLGAGTADTVSLGSKVVNAIIVRGRDQIMLKVTVAEVERDIVKQLGINLSGTLGYGTAVVNFTRRAESDGDFRGNRDLRRRRRIPRPQWLLLHGRQQRHCARECSVGLSTLDHVQEVRREPQLHAGRSQRGPHQH